MTDRIPPVAPEGFAWMPCYKVATVAGDALLIDGAWRIARSYLDHVRAEVAACLMRRLGPDEDPGVIPGVWWYGEDRCTWVRAYEETRPDELGFVMGFDPYAPVRFAGKVPDFGETGLRLVDDSEPGDVGVMATSGPTEARRTRRIATITLPPLPTDPAVRAGIDAALEAIDAGRVDEALGELAGERSPLQEMVDRLSPDARAMYEAEGHEIEKGELRAENERLQARLREVEAERDEARAELERVWEAARARAEPDGPIETAEVRLLRDVFRRIADGEV